MKRKIEIALLESGNGKAYEKQPELTDLCGSFENLAEYLLDLQDAGFVADAVRVGIDGHKSVNLAYQSTHQGKLRLEVLKYRVTLPCKHLVASFLSSLFHISIQKLSYLVFLVLCYLAYLLLRMALT